MRDTILIVDDDEDLREILVDLFECSDLKVVAFSNVDEAKKHLSSPEGSSHIHSIISDYMLGAINGIDFLNFVKDTAELAHIDFYLLTGAAALDFESLLKSQKLKGVIEKPFDSQELVNKFLHTSGNSQKIAA